MCALNKRFALIGVMLIWVSHLFAQVPDTLWTKTYGGTDYDYGESVQQTFDGGYIIAGFTYSFGAGLDDVYLIKTDENGDTLWTKTYGGPLYDYAFSVQQTPDSGYIAVGGVDATSMTGMVYLIKTDPLGDTLWTRRFGGGGHEKGRSVQQTVDGGYIIAGYTTTFGTGVFAVYVIKTDSSGNSQWERTYGGADFDHGFSVQETSDNGFIIAGSTNSFGAGGDDAYLIKTDSNGDTLWTKTYGGAGDEFSFSGLQAADGGYIITGYTSSFGAGGIDVYVVKTDENGDTLWTKTYGGTQDDWGNSIQETDDSGYIIVGGTRSFGADNDDAYIIKIDSSGNALWTKVFGGTSYDNFNSVQQTTDLGYIACGYTLSFGPGNGGVWLMRFEPDTFGIEEMQYTNSKIVHLVVYPNPIYKECNIEYNMSQKTNVNISVFDVVGRLIEEVINENQNAGVYRKTFDMTDLPQGVYFIRLSTEKITEAIKIVLTK
ncbi:T9SS type A sorting domain-containing protein [candidate division WOR-3 bacterium]|nr:T9SS type A sorting domain-containing protein [candidate division WOR-3 bacterium]